MLNNFPVIYKKNEVKSFHGSLCRARNIFDLDVRVVVRGRYLDCRFLDVVYPKVQKCVMCKCLCVLSRYLSPVVEICCMLNVCVCCLVISCHVVEICHMLNVCVCCLVTSAQ